MLFDLLKFVLRTRFSRPFLAFILVMVVYSVSIGRLVPSSGITTIMGYYSVGIIAFLLATALVTGGVMVLKSDRDYLFTMPLSSTQLSFAIFFSQFLAFGVSVLLMFAYLAQAFTSSLLVVDLVALALTFTSLGALAPSMPTKTRVALAVALGLWTLLAFANVPFTPGSAFNGSLYDGTATPLVLAAVTVTLAFRGLSRIELDLVKSMVRTSSAEIKSPNSFAGRTPVGAIYSMNLSTMSLAARLNMGGTSRYVSRRVRTRWVVTATSVAGAAYFIVSLYLGRVSGSLGTGSEPAQVLVSVLLAFFTFGFSQSAITNERIWLSLTSLPATSYFRHLIASKVLAVLMILAPFALADVALFTLGYGDALGALVAVGAVIPGCFVLEICWAAYLAPIQVKADDMTMPAQFNLKQMATALPLIAVILLVSASTVLPIVAAAGGLALCALAATVTLSGRFWSRVLTKLTESGFV